MAQWTEGTARKIFWATALMTAACLGVAAARVLEALRIWRSPSLPAPYGGILTWVLLAASILFGMDRGIPRDGLWAGRLVWMRRALLASAFIAVFSLFQGGG